MGPRLSDKEFFAKVLNLDIDGLEEVKEAVELADFVGARRYFSKFIREKLQPEGFFSIPFEVENNDFKLQDESDFEAADRICELKLISCGTMHDFRKKVDWYENPTPNKYEEWTWQLNRHHEFKILAKAYRDTGNEKYAKSFVELFDSWVKQAIAPENVPHNATLAWRTIEMGIRMGTNWPYVLHSFYKSKYFTDDILVDWYKSVWEHGKRLRDFCSAGNWLIMEMNGLAHIGILYPIFNDSEEWKMFAFSKLEKELEKQIYPDDFHYELSTNYHEVVIDNYFRIINTAKAFNIEVPEKMLKKLENACETYIKLMMPDGSLPNLNDGTWEKAKTFLAKRIDTFSHREDFKWAVSDGELGVMPEFTSVCLPYSGFAVMRSSWDKSAVYGIFDSAPFGKGHQHEDKLSFMLYANKKLLVGEGGNYAYDDSEIRKYVLSTRSHNTIRVDGCDQNRRKNYKWEEGDIKKHSGIKFVTNTEYDFVEGEYYEHYGKNKEINVLHRRSIYFVKKDIFKNDPFFIVVDRLFPGDTGEHQYEILWHLEEDNVIKNDLTLKTDNLAIFTSYNKTMTLELKRGEKDSEWQGWKIGSCKQGDYREGNAASYKVSGDELRVVTVLYPCYSKCHIDEIRALEKTSDSKIEFISNGKVVYTFDEIKYCF